MWEPAPTLYPDSIFFVALCALCGERLRFAAKPAFTTENTKDYRETLRAFQWHTSGLMRRKALARFAWLLAIALLLPGASSGDAQVPTEYQVKAAYIFNFLKFVEWPADSPDPPGKWVVGVVGDSPVGEELTRLSEGKEVLGRSLQVKKLQGADSCRDCNILFISASERKRWPTILSALRGSSVLTVADMEDFVGAGGMIQLFVEDTRVRMVIDVSATNRARLKISSKMLLLARVVGASERGIGN